MKLPKPIDLNTIFEMLVSSDVNQMSLEAFGEEYSEVKSVIYPSPKYRSFAIKKRDGSNRIIHEPRLAVKELQLKALKYLQKRQDTVRPCVHGFVKGRSILTNAQAHCERRAEFLLNIDLKDFFPSITFFRVRGVLQKPPFNLSFEVATVIAQLCTYQGTLPQGAPTSPYLSNLICRSLDRDLMALAKRHRCTYTRYADDMTFSFSVRNSANLPKNICSFDGGIAVIGDELRALIASHTFTINDKKTRISSKNTRQEVTGLVINKFPNIPRRFVDEVRGALHAWGKHGYTAAQQRWEERVSATIEKPLNDRAWSRQTRRGTPPQLSNYLWGKLLFIRMVRQGGDPLYNRLAEQYNSLVEREKPRLPNFRAPTLPISFEVHSRDHTAKALYVVEWQGDVQLPSNALGETDFVYVQGTAFAYRRSDMLVTCEHVFRCEQEGGKQVDFSEVAGAVLTVTNRFTGDALTATLLHRDIHRDLAVLKLENPRPNMRHFVCSSAVCIPTQPAWLLGFPNWSPGRPPSLVPTSVTSVFPKGSLKRFEVSAMIRKGNSGGPITTTTFDLLGVAQEGATQAEGNNQCLCVSEIDAWLDSLVLTKIFEPHGT